MYIFMEYCDEGTLEEVSRLGLQEHVIRLYSKQITTAINVLHEHGIVHRDIKGLHLSAKICFPQLLSFFYIIVLQVFIILLPRSQYLPHIFGLDKTWGLWLLSEAEEQCSDHAWRGEQHTGNSR